MLYNDKGWPVLKAVDVLPKRTPEEKKLEEALRLLASVPHTDDVKLLIEQVLTVVGDYSHMHARVEELEDEIETRDERITELEEQLHALPGSDPLSDD